MKFIKIFIPLFIFCLCFYQNIFANSNILNYDSKLYINNIEYVNLDPIINIDDHIYMSVDDIHFIWGYGVIADPYAQTLKLSHNTVNDVHKFVINNDRMLNQDYNNIFQYDYSNIVDTKNINLCDMQKFELFAEDISMGNAYYHNDTFYIPLRNIANINKCNIQWDEVSKQINMEYNIGDIYNKEVEYAILYKNNIGFDYLYIVFSDAMYNSKSVLAIEWIFNSYNSKASNLKEFLANIDPNEINSTKMINLNEDQYENLVKNTNELLLSNSTDIPTTTYICDFPCYVLNKNDNYESAFSIYPGNSTTKQYTDMKKYLKEISGYEMQYNHIRMF